MSSTKKSTSKAKTKSLSHIPDKERVELLYLLQSFETYYAYWAQSYGELYNSEISKCVSPIVESLENIIKRDKKFISAAQKRLGPGNDIEELIANLKKWADNKLLNNSQKSHFTDKFKIWGPLTVMKIEILTSLDISTTVPMTLSSAEEGYTPDALRYRPHLPRAHLKISA